MAGTVKQSANCDILIAGAGLAGISLLYRAMKEGHWRELSIIVVDRCSTQNWPHKNWSFWKKTAGPFDHLICKSWDKLSFFSTNGVQKALTIDNYAYHTIRSDDFYSHCLTYLRGLANISFINEDIVTFNGNNVQCYLETTNYTITSRYIFNSIYHKPILESGSQYFLQHFKGLLIKTADLHFDPEEGYLMDFRTSQELGTSFFYTLPFSSTELFVEYTIFSKSTLTEAAYDEKISTYLQNVLQIGKYQVMEHEYGVIPMTDHVFSRFQGNIVNIGSAGGDTRGATGYTFTNVQKTISSILACWSLNKTPFFKAESISLKHRIYDSCLLNVMAAAKYKGHQIFEDLFTHAKASSVFSFLDAESTFTEDAAVITSLKPLAFLNAMIVVLKKMAKRKKLITN